MSEVREPALSELMVEVALWVAGSRLERGDDRRLGCDPALTQLAHREIRFESVFEQLLEDVGAKRPVLLALGRDPLHLERRDVRGVLEQREIRHVAGIVQRHKHRRPRRRHADHKRHGLALPDTQDSGQDSVATLDLAGGARAQLR